LQFKSSAEAYSATKLDGSAVGDNLRLVAKISDPAQKQERQGAMHEGREIHVSNVDFKASEDDLKGVFSKYGTVEVARMPRKADGGSKGFGFVVFSSKVGSLKLNMGSTDGHRMKRMRPSRCTSRSSDLGRCR
jgi:RNA recognition motif-containing protein